MIRMFRIWRAKRRLAQLVNAKRNSPEIVQYRKYRTAALKGIARKRGVA